MERKKSQEHLRNIVLTAVLAAMVYVLTAFVKIPTPQGYIHIGDGIIYLAAALLPTPYAMAAGASGAGMSDYLSGYAMWVLPTMIIKALSASLFTASRPTVINRHNGIALLPAVTVSVVGYYFASVILYGDWGAALAAVPTNCIQGTASAALFFCLGLSLDRLGLKKRLLASAC